RPACIAGHGRPHHRRDPHARPRRPRRGAGRPGRHRRRRRPRPPAPLALLRPPSPARGSRVRGSRVRGSRVRSRRARGHRARGHDARVRRARGGRSHGTRTRERRPPDHRTGALMSTYWTTLDSPLGPLLLTAGPDGELTSLSLPGQRNAPAVPPDGRPDAGPFREAEEQLGAYFAGDLKDFRLPLRTTGTPFREKVWAALDAIPYGATTSSGEIAARIGAPRAAVRAVGGAIG